MLHALGALTILIYNHSKIIFRVNSRQDSSAGQACNPCLPYIRQNGNTGLGSQAGVDQFQIASSRIRGTRNDIKK